MVVDFKIYKLIYYQNKIHKQYNRTTNILYSEII